MRETDTIQLPAGGIGVRHQLLVHRYGSSNRNLGRVYIQGSLHADEIPGLLVCHHLIKMLDAADARGDILKEIVIVPYANPIGLSQILMGSHLGRFSLDTGVNFNRDWLDVTEKVAAVVKDHLKSDDAEHNVRIIREALFQEASKDGNMKIENVMKRELYKIAAISDIVLDLHCDTEALLHMYTHDRLWPQMADLAFELGSTCNIVAGKSGGNPFDEAMSCPWAALADMFPEAKIPMACESVTVELRGEVDVFDHLAIADAEAIYRFLQRRGYIAMRDTVLRTVELQPVYPLTGVDMIEATKAGVAAWTAKVGDMVNAGDVLGEIVDIEDPNAPRVPIVSNQAGVIFGIRCHKLVRPGQIVIKVAGDSSLSWRKGNLLTSK